MVATICASTFPPSSNMSNRGRGRGRGGRGRVGGRGKRPKRKKPSSSAAERTEDDDSSIELVVPPSRPSHPPSTSSTGGEEKKTYRKFEADDAAFCNTLIEQAAQDRIKAMRENPKNPGRLPRGFGSKQIEAFSKRAPTLRITESDIDNRRRLIAAKSKKGEADAQEERMPAARSIRATMSSALNTTASTLAKEIVRLRRLRGRNLRLVLTATTLRLLRAIVRREAKRTRLSPPLLRRLKARRDPCHQ